MDPAPTEWLDGRLRVLWKSSTPAKSIDVMVWLSEHVRLLGHLPACVLSKAIDEAVVKSADGFMPGIGQIRAIADPMFAEMERQLHRLRMVVNASDERALPPPRAKPDEAERQHVGAMLRDLVEKLEGMNA